MEILGPLVMQIFSLADVTKIIWTSYQLLIREWPNQYFCPLCHQNLEIVFHLLIDCPIVLQLWIQIGHWCSWPSFNTQRWTPNRPIPKWFGKLVGSSSSAKAKGAWTLAILVYWSIWCEQNAQVFCGQKKSVIQIVAKIKDEARLWIRAGAKQLLALVGIPVSE
jgi:hypothetical protein